MRFWWQKPEPESTVPVIELTPPDNLERQPNWERILYSDIWTQEIYPYYFALRQNALEKLMEAKTAEEFRFMQGQAKALDAMIKTPAQMVALEVNRQTREARNEENDNGRRGSATAGRVAKLAARG